MRTDKPYRDKITGINYIKTPRPVGEFSKFRVMPEHYQAFKPHPHFPEVMVARCLATNRREPKAQCGSIAIKGVACCRIHNGRSGRVKRTPQGEANRIAASTIHGERSAAAIEKKLAINKTHRTLKQLSQALDLREFKGAPQNKPTLADVLPLLAELEL